MGDRGERGTAISEISPFCEIKGDVGGGGKDLIVNMVSAASHVPSASYRERGAKRESLRNVLESS